MIGKLIFCAVYGMVIIYALFFQDLEDTSADDDGPGGASSSQEVLRFREP